MQGLLPVVVAILTGITLPLVVLIYRQLNIQMFKNSTDLEDVKTRLIRIEEHTPSNQQQIDHERERERTANLIGNVVTHLGAIEIRLNQHIESQHG